jgi:hypothetical protein
LDIEAPVRAKVRSAFGGDFQCFEEVDLETSSGRVRADLVLVSVVDTDYPFALAVEVKSHQNDNAGKLKECLFQASKYVGAITSKHLGTHGKLKIAAACIFPAPKYIWSCDKTETACASQLLTGIMFAFDAFKVGTIDVNEMRSKINFGPNQLWASNNGFFEYANQRFKGFGFAVAKLRKPWPPN